MGSAAITLILNIQLGGKKTLRYVRWSIGLLTLIATLSAGCARMSNAPGSDVRSELAPGGKLRVGVYHDNPLPTAGEGNSDDTGVLHTLSVEIGKELAKRLGVEFQAVLFDSQLPVF